MSEVGKFLERSTVHNHSRSTLSKAFCWSWSITNTEAVGDPEDEASRLTSEMVTCKQRAELKIDRPATNPVCDSGVSSSTAGSNLCCRTVLMMRMSESRTERGRSCGGLDVEPFLKRRVPAAKG